ncbi:MAG: hypothetical protein AAF228_09300 [Pseudomonadota bacterium]
MLLSARLFVVGIFIFFALSFITLTSALYYEFRETYWFDIALFYSHLFFFFPTFGIIALIAFYYPSAILVDIYWRHVPWGKCRFAFGMIVLVAASYGITMQIQKGSVGTFWGVKPSVLKADKGEPAGCDPSKQSCLRLPVLDALSELRLVSQGRVGVRVFTRTCTPDPLLAIPQQLKEKRFCFVTKTKTDAQTCCQAQERFANAFKKFYTPIENRSLTETFYVYLLPIYIYFLLVLLIIGFLLATRRRQVDKLYPDYVDNVERGLIIGAVIMLVWPLTNQAFIQSNHALYGTFTDGIYTSLTPILTLTFAAWALMLLFFFFRRFEKDLEAVGKIAGVIVSAFAVLKYEEIIDYSVRFAGSGASYMTLAVLGLFAFLALMVLLFVEKPLPQPKLDKKKA